MDDEENVLLDVLKETDLTQFRNDLAIKLQITKIEHFDHVKDSDLKNIGLSQPAIRRLQKAVKDKRHTLKKTKKTHKDNSPTFSLPRRRSLINRQAPPSRLPSSTDAEPTCLIAREDIKLYESLGEGSFGVVKRAVWNQAVGRKLDVAVKLVRNNDGFAEDFMNEVDRMHKLKHPNLIRLYGLIISKPLMMVVELCSGGALLDRLRHPQKPVLLLTHLMNFALQIVEGMSYLEAKGFIHRDLAARNVLLATEDEHVVKIGDFGLMRALRNNEDHYVMSGRKKVPFAWCPPESLIKRQFSPASDVWSFGVTLWEMFSFGEEPWCGYAGPEVLQKVSGGERLSKPDACPLAIYQLMRQCWANEPTQRPTFAALKELLKETEIQRGDSRECQTGEGLLEIALGDKIIVVDGGPDSYYWFGQNTRTRKFGKFARKLVNLDIRVSSRDISNPLKGSFVHTGHGDVKGGASWGHPEKIDDIYLRNPMPLIDLNEDEKKKSTSSSFDTISIPKPPKSDRHHSSRGAAYSSGCSPSNAIDPYDFGAVGGGTAAGADSASMGSTATDESKGSSAKSADSWHNFSEGNEESSVHKNYYSFVPTYNEKLYDEQPVATDAAADAVSRIYSFEHQPAADASRFYDSVPQDPDPFEIPSQVKVLTNSQRYSQLYATTSRRTPTSSPTKSNNSNRSSSFQFSFVDASNAQNPTLSKSSNSSSSVLTVRNDLLEKRTSLPSASTYQISAPSTYQPSPTYQTPSSPYNQPSSSPYKTPTSPYKTPASQSQLQAPVASYSAPPPVSPYKAPQDFAQKREAIGADLERRLNLTRNDVGGGVQSNLQSSVFSISNNWTGGYASAFGGAAQTKQWTPSQTWTPNLQTSGWSTMQNVRTFSEPDVSRNVYSTGTLQPSTGSPSKPSPAQSKQVLDLFDPLSDKPPSDLVQQVQASVPFVAVDRCGQVLKRCNLNVDAAVQELKIQKLVDMGLGEREACRKALLKNGWNIELAASSILG